MSVNFAEFTCTLYEVRSNQLKAQGYAFNLVLSLLGGDVKNMLPYQTYPKFMLALCARVLGTVQAAHVRSLRLKRHFGKTTEERSSVFEIPALHSSTDFCRMKEKPARLLHRHRTRITRITRMSTDFKISENQRYPCHL